MLRYMLVMLLYAITYCMASDIKTDTPVNGLIASVQKLLPNTNESLTLGQQIYHYKLSNTNENLIPAQLIYNYKQYQSKMQQNSDVIQIAGSGYLITPGIGAHKFHAPRLTWNKARRICVQEGGQLAIINSISEEKILLRIMEENKIDEAWLGIHDFYEEGDWNTIMGESLGATGYSKWYPGEPNNYGQNQACGTLEKPKDVVGLSDRGCNEKFGFFCEIVL